MDVVKKNIEKLRGSVELSTKKDKGTKITLKIPLTLEIMRVMLVEVSGSKYSIPVSDILETLAYGDLKFFKSDGKNEMAKLREEIIPAVSLNKVFNRGNSEENKDDKSKIALIVKRNRKKLCIVVDRIIGTQQIVIKPLPEYMGNISEVSGCSILGSGEISLIIDVGSLIKNVIETS